ncbi:sigma-54 interaction domain-containing protein [Pseudalkalibacillus decolorationis]|uniref:sigma-54 interaction domain-containing protein n=1 Tax=Pseudalkalibacillus decolorationis TaxID=163879 RepID=UPI0021493FA8|nr:sigma 54-interacting transcriptional regulator [Pseudalkalibacillus decolorationis]
MKHKLPKITELIKKDFLYSENESDLKKSQLNSEHENWLFVKQDDKNARCIQSETYVTLDKYNVPAKDMPWEQAWIINVIDDWQDIRSKAGGGGQTLVVKEGRPVGYLQEKHLLEHVLESYIYLEAYYDAILNTTEGSISAIDEDKNTVVWTSGAEKIFSVKKEDIIGKPMADFFPEKMLECFSALTTGEPVYRKQHQPREDLFVLINTSPVKIGERIVGVAVAELDVTKQLQLNKELSNANKTISHLRDEVSRMTPYHDPFYTIKGSSKRIRKTIDKIKQVGSTQARVLILGESGVGKELFAKALHDIREKSEAPFIAVNCGAIPQSLFESELFGYEKGAFSGADSQGKKGKIDLARGGTLFLDEIGELPFDMQVKLLRVLQENKYYRVGGTKLQQTDCRIIAATNKDLKQLVRGGKFRDDLYYRLNIISIYIPPLRERIEDVVELSHMFLYEYASKYNRPVNEIPKSMMSALLNYSWPGNIRELRSTIERLVVFSMDGNLDLSDLPFEPQVDDQPSINYSVPPAGRSNHSNMTLKESLQVHEKEIILQTIEEARGNKAEAAKSLGVSRATLYNRMNKLGIQEG